MDRAGSLGVIILGLLGLFFTLFRKRSSSVPSVISPAPSALQQKADKEQEHAEKEAERERDKKVSQEQERHEDGVKNQVKTLQENTAKVLEDTEATNKVLVNIGKEMRGG